MTAPSQFIKFLTGWRQSLRKLVPNWQTRRPGKENGWRFLWSMVTPLDVEIENTLQGINDWAPGSPDATPTALPLIAQSRGLIQGEAETNDQFAARLVAWRTTTSKMGKSELLAQEIQRYLGNNPKVRIIERIWSASGTTQAQYITANTDGTTSRVVANWDWDSVSGGFDDRTTFNGATARGYWSDFWIVVYTPEWAVTGSTLASLVPIWGRTNIGTGHAVGPVAHDVIARLVKQWKGAHTFCRGVIWSYDATLFDPATPSLSGNPDGTWGFWARGPAPARNLAERYWVFLRGGG